MALIAPFAHANSEQDRRTEAGLRIFGSVMAADIDLQKKAIADGKLLLVIYYASDARRAEELAKNLRVTPSGEPKKLGGLDVEVEITNDPAFRAYASRVPAGIFLAQSPPRPVLNGIVQYGIAHRIIVYSPFEGHVESGVHGGLFIGAQMRPYINIATLQASQIALKPMFMRVAKVFQ